MKITVLLAPFVLLFSLSPIAMALDLSLEIKDLSAILPEDDGVYTPDPNYSRDADQELIKKLVRVAVSGADSPVETFFKQGPINYYGRVLNQSITYYWALFTVQGRQVACVAVAQPDSVSLYECRLGDNWTFLNKNIALSFSLTSGEKVIGITVDRNKLKSL